MLGCLVRKRTCLLGWRLGDYWLNLGDIPQGYSLIMEKQTSLGQWTGFVWVLVFSPAEWPPAWQASCHLHAFHCEEAAAGAHIPASHAPWHVTGSCGCVLIPAPRDTNITGGTRPKKQLLISYLPRLELPRCSGHLLKSLIMNPRPSALLLLTSVRS